MLYNPIYVDLVFPSILDLSCPPSNPWVLRWCCPLFRHGSALPAGVLGLPRALGLLLHPGVIGVMPVPSLVLRSGHGRMILSSPCLGYYPQALVRLLSHSLLLGFSLCSTLLSISLSLVLLGLGFPLGFYYWLDCVAPNKVFRGLLDNSTSL
jgi:hypothetical protein